MVVIVILGVLAALVVPRVLERPDEARAHRGEERHRGADAGAQALSARQPALSDRRAGSRRAGHAPGAAAGARRTGSRTATSTSCANDPWGRPYQYLNPGLKGEIDVWSFGADGQPGGSGARRRHRVVGPVTAAVEPQPRSREPGFTLVEILVVIAILAIAAGVAVASLDGDERGTLDREARRFAGALEYAAQRAQMRHETLGVSAERRTVALLAARCGRTLARARRRRAARARARCPRRSRATPLAYAGQPLRAASDRPVARLGPQRALRVRAREPRRCDARRVRRSDEPRRASPVRSRSPR